MAAPQRDTLHQDAPLPTSPDPSPPVQQQPHETPYLAPEPTTPPALRSCLAEPDCRWSLGGNMPTHMRGQAAVTLDGAIYLVGGESAEEAVGPGGYPLDPLVDPATLPPRNTTVREYDPASRSWSDRARLPSGLYVLTAHAVASKIYVFGGYGDMGFDATTRAYDPTSDTWQALAPMPTPRYIFTSAAVGDKVYVIGGHGPDPASPDTTDVWSYMRNLDIFDPATGWSSGAPAPEPLAGGASCVFEGRIYVFGGEANNLTSIYDVAADSWTRAAPPPLARDGHSCVRSGSSFYLLGGRGAAGVPLDVVEKYDPATGSWQTLDPMPTPRQWFGATALGSDIYTFGGESFGSTERSNFYGLVDVVEVLRTDQ